MRDDAFDYSAVRMPCETCSRAMRLQRDVARRDDWRIHGFVCEREACRAQRGAAGVGAFLEVPAGGEAIAEDGSVHLRNVSLRCAVCDGYPALAHFRRADAWNVYTYECEAPACASGLTRDLYVAVDRDAFARRDPKWRGGARHAGAVDEGDERAS